jgi:hypothetical protein
VQRTIRAIVAITTVASLLADSPSCQPEGNEPSDGSSGGKGIGFDPGNQSLDCTILRPSAPYGIKGPNRDGANFYSFVSRADGDVSCTGKMAEISVTVVFHYKTNEEQGAVAGSTHTCLRAAECTGTVDYRRGQLYCYESYHFDDYAQVTAVFKATAEQAPKRIDSREGRHKVGVSYKPEGICK